MHTPLFITLICFSSCLFGQDSSHINSKAPWDDTAFIAVALNKSALQTKKIVVYNIGQKATVFVRTDSLISEAKAWRANCIPAERKDFDKIISFLTQKSAKKDTIVVNDAKLEFDNLIPSQILSGNARVFYRKYKIFVDTIYHRLEKYGMYAHRFFYLPDMRPFFSFMEYSGILEKGRLFSDPTELMNFAEKLRDSMKQ